MDEINVGEAGFTFIRDSLLQAKGVGKELFGLIVSRGGVASIRGLVTNGTSLKRAIEFEAAPNRPVDHIGWMYKKLQEMPAGVLYIQDSWAKPEDLLSNPALLDRSVVSQGKVFYYLVSTETSLEEVRRFCSKPISYEYFAFFVTSQPPVFGPGAEVPALFWQDVLPYSVAIFVTAYDRDSWVFWESPILTAMRELGL